MLFYNELCAVQDDLGKRAERASVTVCIIMHT